MNKKINFSILVAIIIAVFSSSASAFPSLHHRHHSSMIGGHHRPLAKHHPYCGFRRPMFCGRDCARQFIKQHAPKLGLSGYKPCRSVHSHPHHWSHRPPIRHPRFVQFRKDLRLAVSKSPQFRSYLSGGKCLNCTRPLARLRMVLANRK